MKKIILSLVLISGLVSFSYGQKHEWQQFESGFEDAKLSQRPILIDFYADWCHWCKVMDEKTFSDSTVKKYLKENFVAIKLDSEDTSDSIKYKGKQLNSSQLTKVFGVTSFPSLAFLDKNQKPIALIPGYLKKDKFLSILKYIKNEIYKKKISLKDYLEE